MKDLYCFDADKDSAVNTYEMVNDIYDQFFKYIGVPFVKGGSENDLVFGLLSCKLLTILNIHLQWKRMPVKWVDFYRMNTIIYHRLARQKCSNA